MGASGAVEIIFRGSDADTIQAKTDEYVPATAAPFRVLGCLIRCKQLVGTLRSSATRCLLLSVVSLTTSSTPTKPESASART